MPKNKSVGFDTKVVDFYKTERYHDPGEPVEPKSAKGDIGIELEVEGKIVLPDTKSFFWEQHAEGSLRGESTEFVMSKPVPIDMLHQAVVELKAHTDKCKFVADSPRTSVHIHVNVQRYTARELYSVLMVYWAFENILVRMNGPLREGNLFCLRQSDAEGLFRALLEQIRRQDIFFRDGDGRRRYAALNLSSLSKFGSLEFRFIKGLTDFDEIEDWARALYEFCEKARRLSWDEIIQLFHYDRGAARLNTVEQFFSPKFIRKMRDYVTPDFMLASMQENLDNIFVFYKALKNADKVMQRQQYPEEDESDEAAEVYTDRLGAHYTRPADTDDEDWAEFVAVRGLRLVEPQPLRPANPAPRFNPRGVVDNWAAARDAAMRTLGAPRRAARPGFPAAPLVAAVDEMFEPLPVQLEE